MSHPDDSTIERFVMGDLDDEDVIAHVAACDECSRKLHAQAELEVAMLDVRRKAAEVGAIDTDTDADAEGATVGATPILAAGRARSVSARSSLARRAIGPIFAFAAAAAVFVWAGHDRLLPRALWPEARDLAGAREGSERAAVPVASCNDGPKQLECIAEAHRSGARLEYPRGPLAELGSKPGLTVLVDPRFSEGIVVDVDDLLVNATRDVEACAERAIVSQDAPIEVGEIGINFTISPDGPVEETQTSFVLPIGRPVPDVDAPMERTDLILARCLRTTAQSYPFKGAGRPVRMSLVVKYVWRE